MMTEPSSKRAVSVSSRAPEQPLATITSSSSELLSIFDEWNFAIAERASGVPHAFAYPAAREGDCNALVIAFTIAGQGGKFPYAVGSPSCLRYH